MLRPARLVTMVLLAMFAVAVPTAVAQSPVGDQYLPPIEGAVAPPGANNSAGAPATNSAGAPVQLREPTPEQADELPITGGQSSPIALIVLALLALLALLAAGLALIRRRASAATT